MKQEFLFPELEYCPRCEVGNCAYCYKREHDPPYRCNCLCPVGVFGEDVNYDNGRHSIYE